MIQIYRFNKYPYLCAKRAMWVKAGLMAFLLFLCVLPKAFAQKMDGKVGKNDTIVLPGYVVNGDTVPYIWLPEVNVVTNMIYHNDQEKLKYLILKRDVLTVLPYAQYAAFRYRALKASLDKTSDRKERKALIKALEADIKKNYEKQLKNLTITQGRILIKLIDRQTGATSYELVKELKSGFTAFFYQSIAGLFGDNLKDKYDPDKDKDIEFILQSMGYSHYYTY